MSRVCLCCSERFVVAPEDHKFYEQISPLVSGRRLLVPPPKLCPRCRQQRRLAWRNEQHLYRRACDLCNKSIVSVHPSDAEYPVYCVECWWSDRWNPREYGIALDLSRPFFELFSELQQRVPQLAIQNDNGIASENSEYCYDISRAKNCYRVVGSWYMEECLYSLNVNRCRFVVDCNTVSIDCELAYECLDSQRLYRCAYLEGSESCSDCFFGYDLKGCSNCFGCHGLRQSRFHIFNTPYSEREYWEKLREFDLGSYSQIKTFREQFDAWSLKQPRRAANIQNSEDSCGNNLFNCKGVLGYSIFNGEYSRYVDRCDGPKSCYDLINTGGAQWCYDCVTPDDSFQVMFSVWCWKSQNVIYSDNCHSSRDLFGCISMRRSNYCILNREYSKEEYERNITDLVAQLERDGLWGELLPVNLSPFSYNGSAAMEYYPLTRALAESRGWRWSESLPDLRGKQTISLAELPDSIAQVSDGIVNEVLECGECSRNFKIIPSELKFYRTLPAPLPRSCPACRHTRRFERKTPTEIFERSCAVCGSATQSCYRPGGSEILYCDSCYRQKVYGTASDLLE